VHGANALHVAHVRAGRVPERLRDPFVFPMDLPLYPAWHAAQTPTPVGGPSGFATSTGWLP
jgi:hypothetical protein